MNRKPCLAIIQVGSNAESNKSVNIKKILCKEVGIETLEYLFPEQTSQETVLATSNYSTNYSIFITIIILSLLLLSSLIIISYHYSFI